MNFKGNLLDLSEPVVMGILNVTPDSFYDGGSYSEEHQLLSKVSQMLEEGAAIIDVGGYSSRPQSEHISEDLEIARVKPVIEAIIKEFPEALISVDTFRSNVARAAVEAGAGMVNDISGGNLDEKMFSVVADLNVPYVLMHMKGTPQTMARQTGYENILMEIIDYFQKKIFELKQFGIKDVIVDPGFGFAKTIDQNYELLKNLNYFKCLNLPILTGVSRKSMISRKLGVEPSEALNGTTVLNTISLMNGASILRVHDVKYALEAIKLFKSTYH